MEARLQDLADKAVKYAANSGAQYCDARAEQQERKSVLIENGEIEHIRNNEDIGIGIRLIKNGAWEFFSIIGLECNKIISNMPKIIKTIVNPWYTINSKYFVSSEGSEILQNFTDVVVDMVATAHQSGLTQSVNITEGGRGGMEQISNDDKVQKSASNIATKASQLLDAKPAKEETTTVIMNPDFVSLLTHEILGHPSEADRVLGKEMAWAGGAWWKGKIGEKIGSEKLNVFDDPTIKESLGWYYFDD